MVTTTEVESALNDVVLEVSKAVLRSPQLDEMHESDSELYLFLYVHFAKAAARQRREDTIAITDAAALAILTNVLAPTLKAAGQSKTKRPVAASAPTLPSYQQTGDAPSMSHRALREQLHQLPSAPNLTAFAEVLEMCRYVDQKLGQTVPFGSTNVLHFCALMVTLWPHRRLFDLIALVWAVNEIPEARRIQIFYVWSVVDAPNRDALLELCTQLHHRPNLTIPMLLEFFPAVEFINTTKYKAAMQQASGAGPLVSTGKTIVHGADDEPVLSVAPSAAPVVQAPSSGRGGEDSDDDDGRTDEDRAFWANLVS